MKPSTLPRCKIPQIPSAGFRRLKNEVARLGAVATGLVLVGYFALEPSVSSVLGRVRESARESALVQFEQGWKSRLLADSDLMNSACKTWYFGMSAKDRVLR